MIPSVLILVLSTLRLLYCDVTFATMSKDICGEIIGINKNETTRTLVSRAYTKNTELKSCSWEIMAPPQYVIVLSFSYINLTEHEKCMTENVTVKSKLESNIYHHHGVFCGTTPPSQIISLGSTLKITFSFASSTSGFVANYVLDSNECAEFNGGCHHKCYNTMQGRQCGCQKGFTLQPNMRSCRIDACGGFIYGQKLSSGLITSPSFPYIYPNKQKCEWEIVSPPLHKIMLNFTYFNLEEGHNCTHDNITVYSRLGIHHLQKHGSYCGSSKPPVIVSEGNVMRIEFLSDDSNSRLGFVAHYHVIADECAESNGGCQHNCVNTLMGHECSCRTGFALTIDKHGCREVCGGLFFDFNGIISSPLFPENYPPHQSCQWNIMIPQGYRILLNFYHFDLEDSKNCSADHLTLYSRESVDINQLIGVFCGSELPAVIISDTRNLVIRFESDWLNSRTGFTAIYSFVDVDECATNNGGCKHECLNTVGSHKCSCRSGFTLHSDGHSCLNLECTSNITAASGTFSSVNYPNSYPPNTNCLWRFTVIAGHRIQLTIVNFDVEEQQNCLSDYLSIYDGDISDDMLKGKYCGNNGSRELAFPIVSSRNEMIVEFRSDSSIQEQGFTASYTSVCGGILTATTVAQGLYSHAGYGDEPYGPGILCDWNIVAPLGETIKFLVTDIQLEGNCGYDYLLITEQVIGVDKSYGKYCGSSNVPEITSRTNILKIQFKTDSTNNYRGFAAEYYIA